MFRLNSRSARSDINIFDYPYYCERVGWLVSGRNCCWSISGIFSRSHKAQNSLLLFCFFIQTFNNWESVYCVDRRRRSTAAISIRVVLTNIQTMKYWKESMTCQMKCRVKKAAVIMSHWQWDVSSQEQWFHNRCWREKKEKIFWISWVWTELIGEDQTVTRSTCCWRHNGKHLRPPACQQNIVGLQRPDGLMVLRMKSLLSRIRPEEHPPQDRDNVEAEDGKRWSWRRTKATKSN